MGTMAARAFAVALLSTVALAAISGCGGDSGRRESEGGQTSAQSTSTQRSTAPKPVAPVAVARATDPARRAYIARVDRVCSQLDPERKAAEEQVGTAIDAQQAAKAYDDSIASGENELHQIEAIPAPPGEKRLIRTNVFDAIHRQLALRGQIRDALAALDVTRLRALRAELDGLSRSLTGFARGYGFQVCGED